MKWIFDAVYRIVIVLFLYVIYLSVTNLGLADSLVPMFVMMAIGVFTGAMSGRDN